MDDNELKLNNALDAMQAALMAEISKEQSVRILVGYFTSIEMFSVPGNDKLGKVPEPVMEFHRAVKKNLGVV